MLLDNGFTAAHDWRERIDLASARLEAAGREGRRRRGRGDRCRARRDRVGKPRQRLGASALLVPQPILPDRQAI